MECSDLSGLNPLIRRAGAADADVLQSLIDDVYRDATWLPPGVSRVRRLSEVTAGEQVWVAVERLVVDHITGGSASMDSASGDSPTEGVDERIVGMLSIYEPEAFIHHLYVAAESRSGGIGSCLLNAAETWLPYPWRLKCVTANTRALAFYARQGWLKEAEGDGEEGPYVQLIKSS